jgi:hypothetical protein
MLLGRDTFGFIFRAKKETEASGEAGDEARNGHGDGPTKLGPSRKEQRKATA